MTLNSLMLIITFYLMGFIFEFNITMNQINSLEKHRNYIYNELKLTKTELIIAVLLVSAAWMFVEPYVHLKNLKNQNNQDNRVWIRK